MKFEFKWRKKTPRTQEILARVFVPDNGKKTDESHNHLYPLTAVGVWLVPMFPGRKAVEKLSPSKQVFRLSQNKCWSDGSDCDCVTHVQSFVWKPKYFYILNEGDGCRMQALNTSTEVWPFLIFWCLLYKLCFLVC